jgi:membrane-bound ClpP family serine protease
MSNADLIQSIKVNSIFLIIVCFLCIFISWKTVLLWCGVFFIVVTVFNLIVHISTITSKNQA